MALESKDSDRRRGTCWDGPDLRDVTTSQDLMNAKTMSTNTTFRIFFKDYFIDFTHPKKVLDTHFVLVPGFGQVFAYGLDLFFTPFQSAKAYDVLRPAARSLGKSHIEPLRGCC